MAEYQPRAFSKYKDEIVPYMMKKFGYKNINQVPKIVKISLNMGVGDAKQDAKLLAAPLVPLAVRPQNYRTAVVGYFCLIRVRMVQSLKLEQALF